MFVSKHHYALELARRGNTVYFLNPPAEKGRIPAEKILIRPSGLDDRLYLIDHRLSFPYNIKFHFIGLFHALMKPHVKRVLRKIGRPVDIVWSFDLGHLYPFRFFPGALKVFHPVDEPLNQTAIDSAQGSQVIFSVTNEILAKYGHYPAPRHFINHGVAAEFLHAPPPAPSGDAIHVGLSGNFMRGDIDRETLLRIFRENPAVVFDCWGSYTMAQSNIAGDSGEATLAFIEALKRLPNVKLHGAIPMDQLSRAIHGADAFLICYDIAKDQSKGTNYHKIMEYLSTGKVIISNNVTTYKDRPDLVQMTSERDTNDRLPQLFADVIRQLDHFNSPELRRRRIEFARDNGYGAQIDRIARILTSI
jgi:glycosyltransferase involved in cell wall biosynthesis